MKTKPRDVPYCAVRRDKIQAAHPVLDSSVLSSFHRFIIQRYKIHIRKDVLKREPPWTSDRILQTYRFTNVRREHDRETRWLIEHITSNRDLSFADKVYNCILFRLYNKHQTAELLGIPIKFCEKDFDPESYRTTWENALKQDPHRVFFTGAFLTSGLKRALSQYVPKTIGKDVAEMRPLWFMRYLLYQDFASTLHYCKDQEEAYNKISYPNGIGRFLAYQIFVDLTYIPEFPFSENEFTVAGPGCSAGLEYLFKDRDGMTDEECVFWLRDNLDRLFVKTLGNWEWDANRLLWDLPLEDRCFNVMSIENCLCELSKYLKSKEGTGRPRKRYEGGV